MMGRSGKRCILLQGDLKCFGRKFLFSKLVVHYQGIEFVTTDLDALQKREACFEGIQCGVKECDAF